jgi:hypothetical protein
VLIYYEYNTFAFNDEGEIKIMLTSNSKGNDVRKLNTKIKAVVMAASVMVCSGSVFADNQKNKDSFVYDYASCDTGRDGSYNDNYKKGYRIISPRYSFDNISYYVNPDMGYQWVQYAEQAAAKINAIGSSLNVTIVSTMTPGSSHIYHYNLGQCVSAGALPPSNGKIGKEIQINPDLSGSSDNEIVATLIHEMLHTVGFKHAAQDDKGAYISNTDHIGMWREARYKPIMMPNVGNYKLTFLDKYAIKKMFPK